MKDIFIVDDNELLLSYLGEQLTKAGHRVTTTTSSLQALKMLVGQTADVVFIDYFLPHLNGDKLCRVIRKMEHMKDAYLVVMSAAASELQLESSNIDANAIIAKGSFKETVQYMLSSLGDSETSRNTPTTSEAIGFDSVHPRQMTSELLNKNRHLQTMLDSISEGIVEIIDGRILYTNPTAMELLNRSEDQLLATYLSDLFDPPALAEVESLIDTDASESTTHKQNHLVQLQEKTLSIRKLPFLDDADAIILLITDVTAQMRLEAERTRAESTLRESEEMARVLLNATTEAVALTDPRGVVIDVNEECAQRYGKTKAHMVGSILWDLLPRELAEPRKEEAYRALQAAATIRFEDEYRGIWNDNVICPIMDKDGRILRLAVFSRDITEYKKMQERIVRSERLAATGQLASSIAHEVNSPLQAVTSILGTLKKQYSDSEALSNSFDLLSRAFVSIGDTVKNLLDLNRPGKEAKQPTDLNDIIVKTVELVRSLLKENRITARLNLSPDIPRMIISPQQLNHAILNLITNAVEAMTNVSKRAGWKERAAIEGEISIQSIRRNNVVVITVTDTGPGIPEVDLEKVFDPFYTRKKTMGMGIGLSFCHKIIEDHGGTIMASNSPDGGAVFTLALPID